MRANEFRDADKIKMLLWCDRHCCLCNKACGTNIEIAHIDADGPGEIDNAIPLCFECHSEIGRYNDQHPRGNKYKPAELKSRRNQIYGEHTRKLAPPIVSLVTQRLGAGQLRALPDVGFVITHAGDSLPVKVRVAVTIFRERKNIGYAGELYDGSRPWNLNPRHGV